jgi:hypothetical protein
MQQARKGNPAIALLVSGLLAMTPALAIADETPAVEPDASAQPPVDEEARARTLKELERRDAERAQALQQNCEQARAQLQQIVDMPPRNVRQTQPDGTVTRMTEEEHKAYIEKLHGIEAESCR